MILVERETNSSDHLTYMGPAENRPEASETHTDGGPISVATVLKVP